MTIVSNVKQCLTTVKGIEAELSSLALNSLDENATKAFHMAMLKMGDIKDDLQTRVYELEREEPQYKGS
ncbi:DUF1657 domain-containing protein [Neobacillus sp. PS3-40]|uniref:DUF1657 domain-containing protein n=1 Tax=Neobacillus sp. PS3-40 TaxID=3070679 RepID=UPI0027DF41BB|nr:DUF1657 domain-containing protein [Neobacillus sp. PS3-40]WML44782.1 DUF1657 domain-containing protein [Neobacillus sp. PS3-40]